MSRLDYLMQLPWVDPLGWTLIHFLWQGALVGIILWGLLWWMHHAAPQTRHAIAALGMLVCFMLPMATFIWLVCKPEPLRVIETAEPIQPAASPASPLSVTASPMKYLQMQRAHRTGETIWLEQDGTVTIGSPAAREPEPESWAQRYLPWCVGAWLLGVLSMSVRLFGGWWRVRGWRKRAEPVGAAMAWAEEAFARIRERLGLSHRIRLLLSPDAVGPLAMGILRPVVILPASLLTRLPEAHLEAILLHELAHIRRHDYLVNLLQSIVEALLFYHPVVWWLGRELRQTREECCDAVAAVSIGKGAYARALASLEELRSMGHGLAPAARGGSLLFRLRRLIGQPEREAVWTGRNAAWFAALSIALLMAGTLVYSSAVAMEGEKIARTLPAPKGIVVDQEGKPVAGARVWVYYEKSSWELGNGVVEETTTREDGRFVLKRPLTFLTWMGSKETDHYLLFASAPGYAGDWRVLIGALNPEETFRLKLSTPKPQSFEVVDEHGKPLAGAMVWLRAQYRVSDLPEQDAFSTATDSGFASGITDAAGKVTLADLPEDSRSIAVSLAGYERCTDCTTSPKGTRRYVMRHAATLDGRVLDPLGLPVAGAEVWLYPKFAFYHRFVARTDAQGRYRIEGIWSNGKEKDWGKYRVRVAHPRFVLEEVKEVAFAPGEQRAGFDLAVAPGTLVSGTLLDSGTRQPVGGGPVEVHPPGYAPIYKLWSDRQGRFTAVLPPGDFQLDTEGAPFGCYSVIDRFSGSIGYRGVARGRKLDIAAVTNGTIRPLEAIHGKVLLTDGTACPGAKVSAFFTEGSVASVRFRTSHFGPVKTDAAGRFHRSQFPVGTSFGLYAVSADFKYAGVLAPAVHGPGKLLQVVLQPASSLALPMLDQRGNPKPKFSISYYPKIAGVSLASGHATAKSDAQGIIHLKGILPGMEYEFQMGPSQRRAMPLLSAEGKAVVSSLSPSHEVAVIARSDTGEPLAIESIEGMTFNVRRGGKKVSWRVDKRYIQQQQRKGTLILDCTGESTISGGDQGEVNIRLKDGRVVTGGAVYPMFDESEMIIKVPAKFVFARHEPDATIPDSAERGFSGRVLKENGEPLEDVKVSIYEDQDGEAVLSSADGVFRLPLDSQVTGPLFPSIHLEKEGYAPIILADALPGEPFKIKMRSDTRLKGRLLGFDAQPAGHLKVLLKTDIATARSRSGDGRPDEVVFTITTDAQGYYNAPLEPGDYRYEVHGGRLGFLRGSLALGKGAVQALPERMEKGASVTFTVLDAATGKPAPGLQIWIIDQINRTRMNRKDSERITDKHGMVHWDDLLPGETVFISQCFTLQTSPGEPYSPYMRWWSAEDKVEWRKISYHEKLPQGGDGRHMLTFDVQGDFRAAIEVERGVEVSGRVVDVDGKPLSGLAIGIAASSSLVNEERMIHPTDAEGRFHGYIPAGNGVTYNLYAASSPSPSKLSSLHATAVSELFESKPGDRLSFELQAPQGGGFSGRVVNERGEPMEGVEVRAENIDRLDRGSAWRSVASDAEGRFQQVHLRPGEYTVTLWPRGSSWSNARRSEQRVIVKPGGETDGGDFVYGPPETVITPPMPAKTPAVKKASP